MSRVTWQGIISFCLLGLFPFEMDSACGQGVRELPTTPSRSASSPPTTVPPARGPSIPIGTPSQPSLTHGVPDGENPALTPTIMPNSSVRTLPSGNPSWTSGNSPSEKRGNNEGVIPVKPPQIGGNLGQFLMKNSVSSPDTPVSSMQKKPQQNSPPFDPSLQLLKKIEAVTENETEDDRAVRELLNQRKRAEQITAPDRQTAELEEVERREAAYKKLIARRAEAEAGADLFYVPRLKEKFLKDGWCQLFDGQTLFGWQIQTTGNYGGGNFEFGNDEIQSDPYHPGLIYTTMPFGDIGLRFDFCAEKNSEVFLLLKTPPDPECLHRSCYTIVLNSEKSNRPRGLLLGRHSLSLMELRMTHEIQESQGNDGDDVWHTVVLKSDQNNLQVWIDKQSPMTYIDAKPLQFGHVAFLVAKGKARFQNILWQPSTPIPVFGTDNSEKTPWRLHNDVRLTKGNDGVFRLNGSGVIESLPKYGNFVLQMEYFQGITSGASSLFVRSLPEQPRTGYEISLQNFPTLQDREQTVGVDAGSFREIKDARYIRAQDQQWTYLTVAAADRQIMTWVNGVPVCEILDSRKVKEDLSKGPFLTPGVFQLFTPNAESSLQFRNVTVSTY